MTVKSDLLTNIQIFCGTIETSGSDSSGVCVCVYGCVGEIELKIFILSLNGRPCHKMKPSHLAAKEESHLIQSFMKPKC